MDKTDTCQLPKVRRKEGNCLAMMILTAKDIAEVLRISESKAYIIIRQLNQELESKGYFTQRGRCPAQYFYERFGIRSSMKD